MIVDENWAVSIDRVRSFFAQQPDVFSDADDFFYGSCRITLFPAASQLGSIPLQRTQLRMDGPEDELREIYHRFFIRFLSAGG